MGQVEDTQRIQSDGPDKVPDGPGRRKKHVGAFIAGGVAVAVLAAGGIWWAVAAHNTRTQLAAAQQACEQAANEYATARKTYDDALKDKAVVAALKITDKQVKDTKTVIALAKDSKAETPKTVTCPTGSTSKGEVDKATDAIADAASWYTSHTTTIKDDAAKVTASKTAKELDEAKTGLNKKLGEARKLYDSSKDKVQDNKTRDTLKKQLDAAGKLKDATDVKQIRAATDKLGQAIGSVNASVKAKQEADRKAAEEKARKEAEAQAAAAAQAQASSQAQQSYTAPQQSYTPTYTAPAAPQYTAPQVPQYTAPVQPAAPSKPSTGGNSGGGPISGGHGCGSLCTSAPTDTYDR